MSIIQKCTHEKCIRDHPFFAKILNAVFFIGLNSTGYSSIINPVCSSLAAPLHNIWSYERGPILDVPLFKEDILDDLSCKDFKATAFAYPPRTSIQTLPDGSKKWVTHHWVLEPFFRYKTVLVPGTNHSVLMYNISQFQKCNFYQNPITSNFHSITTWQPCTFSTKIWT